MDLSLDPFSLKLIIDKVVEGRSQNSHEGSESHALGSIVNLRTLADQVATTVPNTNQDVTFPSDDLLGNIYIDEDIVIKPKCPIFNI